LRRVTYLSEDGKVVRTVPVETNAASWSADAVGELPSGALILVEHTLPQPDPRKTTSTYRDSTRLVAYVPSDSVVSELGRFPLFDMTVGKNDRGPTARVHPHSPRFHAAVDRAGRGVLVGFSDVPEIRLISPDGADLQRITVPLSPRRVTAEDLAAIERRRARPRIAPGSLPDSPLHMPVFGRVLSTDEGDVWVQAIEELGTKPRWTVIPANGGAPTFLELPRGTHLLEVNRTHVLCLSRGEDDAETFFYATVREH
jgi:hypothetical protein